MDTAYTLFTVSQDAELCDGYKRTERIMRKIRQLSEDLNDALEVPANRPAITCPKDCYNFAMPIMSQLDHEELWVMTLNTRNHVTGFYCLYKGSVNTSQVRVGELFRQAIIKNDPAIILFHNHPSGDPTPSPDDVAITRAVNEAGRLLDVQVLDHIVIGAGRYVSLKERGLGF